MFTDQVISELIQKVNNLTYRFIEAEEKLSATERKLYETERNYTELQLKYAGIETENRELKAKVSKLEARFNSNSRNSSKPLSSDGYQKKPAFPRKKDGKQGSQQGYKGRPLEQVAHPDRSISGISLVRLAVVTCSMIKNCILQKSARKNAGPEGPV